MERDEPPASDDLRHAIRWAAGIGGDDGAVEDMEVEELIKAIPPDKQQLWLDRWRAHMASDEPSPSAPAGTRALPERTRKNRSYVFNKSAGSVKVVSRKCPYLFQRICNKYASSGQTAFSKCPTSHQTVSKWHPTSVQLHNKCTSNYQASFIMFTLC